MASSLLLWVGCVAAALFPPLFGCGVAVMLSSAHWYFLLLLAGISWSMQFCGWVWCGINHNEKYYDATGSLTFIVLILTSLLHAVTAPTYHYPSFITALFPGLLSSSSSSFSGGGLRSLNVRQCVNSLLVLLWCIRLGYHLFSRISRDQKDSRFDSMRDSAAKLLLPWSTQGLWVFLLSLPVTLTNAMLTSDADGKYDAHALNSITWRDYVGWMLWAAMWAVEVKADREKAAFAKRQADAKKKTFIDEGLWHYSRHPNYFGEMSLWFGLFLSCSSAFSQSSHYLAIAGPCMNAFLLRFVSGVPLLEASSDKKFGSDARYQQYKKDTPLLIPRISQIMGGGQKQQ